MNEPAVGDGEEGTMAKDAVHILESGRKVMHRDVHNAYGLMMQKATYEGLVQRDKGKQRLYLLYTLCPFILTRSAFIGS